MAAALDEELEFVDDADVVALTELPGLSTVELPTLPLLKPQAVPMPFFVIESKVASPQISKSLWPLLVSVFVPDRPSPLRTVLVVLLEDELDVARMLAWEFEMA